MATVAQVSAFFQGYNPSGGGSEEWNMWCQAFVSRVAKTFGAFSRDYGSARAARLASGPLNADPNSAPLGAIGYWLWNPDDHVAIHVGGGVWMMGSRHITSAFGGVSKNAGTVSFADFQARAGLQFLGWTMNNGGSTVAIEAPALAANQRRVTPGDAANGRADANTSSAVVTTVAGGDEGTFDQWKYGQSVNGNNVWFRGAFSKAWFWSGGFEGGANTKGLTDANPVVVPPTTTPTTGNTNRTTLNDGSPLNVRSGPGTAYGVVSSIQPNTSVKILAWAKGESALGSTTWFKIGDKQYAAAGGFTSTATTGLTEETVTTTPPVVTPPAATFAKDVDCVTEVIPAHSSNFQVGNFPAKPAKVVVHQFGTPGVNTYQSVINYFTTDHSSVESSQVSAHFVVSGKKITQMVKLGNRAWHAGAKGNDFVGIESDPDTTNGQSADTIKSVQTLIRQLSEKYGVKLEAIRHSSLMSTSCGQYINIERDYSLAALWPTTTPPVVTPPVVTPPTTDLAKEILALRTEVAALAADVKSTRAVIGSALRGAGDAID